MAAKPWTAPKLSELEPGWWVAADPSITATGIVVLSVGPLGVIVASAKKMGESPTDMAGWADTYDRAERLMTQTMVRHLESLSSLNMQNFNVVHEAPAVGPVMRPESATLAGLAFRGAMHMVFHNQTAAQRVYTVHEPVTKNAHAKYICGNGRADKKEEHTALKTHLSPGIRDVGLVSNEATRDALCVALYAANREWKKNHG